MSTQATDDSLLDSLTTIFRHVSDNKDISGLIFHRGRIQLKFEDDKIIIYMDSQQPDRIEIAMEQGLMGGQFGAYMVTDECQMDDIDNALTFVRNITNGVLILSKVQEYLKDSSDFKEGRPL